jgi:hypothetical protein
MLERLTHDYVLLGAWGSAIALAQRFAGAGRRCPPALVQTNDVIQMLTQHQSLSALWRQVAATPTQALPWRAGIQALRLDVCLLGSLQALNTPRWQDAALGDALLGRPALAETPRIFCSRWPPGASATTTSSDPACVPG